MTAPSRGWPADVVHVNEDGWVLINRGRTHGVAAGLRLLVVGAGIRDLRDLYASATDGGEAPVVLRTRRTFEMLEVIHAEERCAVAISERVPATRRPQFYAGPEGELLVWVPLPEKYTWPPVGDGSDAQDADDAGTADAGDVQSDYDEPADEAGKDDETSAGDEPSAEAAPDAQDTPPESADQDDQRWEEALPLNSVSVGDIVVPAVPLGTPSNAPAGVLDAQPATVSAARASASEGTSEDSWDRQYDWMQPKPGAGGA